MPSVPFDVFLTVVSALLGVIIYFVKREVYRHDKRIEKLEERAHENDLAHRDLAHSIDSNAQRSDHQDTLLGTALGTKVSTATVRAAGVEIESEPPSSPMLGPRPRLRSRDNF